MSPVSAWHATTSAQSLTLRAKVATALPAAEPVKLGERCTAWRAEDIRDLIERAASAKAAA